MPLAVVTMSGTTPSCSLANQSPVRQNPVWISSAMISRRSCEFGMFQSATHVTITSNASCVGDARDAQMVTRSEEHGIARYGTTHPFRHGEYLDRYSVSTYYSWCVARGSWDGSLNPGAD
jgi:hypothetical protein